ncbi:hypothetical protein [Brevundimonas sp. UBA2416]|uniref:hypothetical protein n=1 Tax=Brevundimonas sp. UBA2416 TaxID=1946124 RepID=UPI0025BC086E|nr:hypothetical protein [Brevundimonas sp. UBA2416]
MNRRLFLIAAPLALAGCTTTALYASPDAGMVELEPLLSAGVAADSLTIRVMSNGCTTKADFAWFVERKAGRYAVAFGRKKIDACKAMARPLDLTWTYGELGLPSGAAVAVVNPLAAS